MKIQQRIISITKEWNDDFESLSEANQAEFEWLSDTLAQTLIQNAIEGSNIRSKGFEEKSEGKLITVKITIKIENK
jgi:hypothetical protein